MAKRIERITCYMTFEGSDPLTEFNEFLAVNRLNKDLVVRKETQTTTRVVKPIKLVDDTPEGQLELVFRKVNKLTASEMVELPVFTRRWVFDMLNGHPRDAASSVVGSYMDMQDVKNWTAAEREELNEALIKLRLANKQKAKQEKQEK